MTQPTPDGGPAFPTLKATQVDREISLVEGHNGMSLRDYFAAAALPLANSWRNCMTEQDIARNAYWIADAMLKEREKYCIRDTLVLEQPRSLTVTDSQPNSGTLAHNPDVIPHPECP